MEPILYTVSEVAKLLRCNKEYVYKLIRQRLLPAIKLGVYKVRREALLEFLRAHEGMDVTDPGNVVKF